MSFHYYNYYDDDSDAELDKGAASSSSDEEGVPDDIVLSDGASGGTRRFRLERSRSRSSSRERSGRRNSNQDSAVIAGMPDNSSSISGMEEEMEKELDKAVEAAHEEYNRQIKTSSAVTPASIADHVSIVDMKQDDKPADKNYDNVYFDSDEEKDESSEKRKVLSNDELFYDPDMDEADEKWMDKIRRQYHPSSESQAAPSSGGQKKAVPLPNSDAVLNCPACMSLLCVDCQRHETYSHQYRAMFVFNCKVDRSQVMQHAQKAPKSLPSRKSRKRTHLDASGSGPSQEAGSSGDPQDLYFPVNCSVCNTCVAMFDTDEVYHFFNVLASHA